MLDLVAQPFPGPLGDAAPPLAYRICNRGRPSTAAAADGSARTPWNRSITPHRRFAFTTIPLEDAKRVRPPFGCTFNDVVMALCCRHAAPVPAQARLPPDEPLVAGVPVSIRAGDEEDTYQNRVSFLLVHAGHRRAGSRRAVADDRRR